MVLHCAVFGSREMNASNKRWVVIFGGAGRETCVERMLDEGVDVSAILVPKRRSAKLENSLRRLRNLGVTIIEVDKATLGSVLTPYAGLALLSIGFPYLLDGELLKMFRPALNLHPTLLPRYRGPTTAAYILINGEKESGSTVHYMTADMDRGEILAQSSVSLNAFDTVRSLQRKVYATEPQLVMDAIAALEAGVQPRPQDEGQASEFPKRRTPADSEIDPARPLSALFNQIRACDPDEFPAFFYHEGQKVCIRLWRPEKTTKEADEI